MTYFCENIMRKIYKEYYGNIVLKELLDTSYYNYKIWDSPSNMLVDLCSEAGAIQTGHVTHIPHDIFEENEENVDYDEVFEYLEDVGCFCDGPNELREELGNLSKKDLKTRLVFCGNICSANTYKMWRMQYSYGNQSEWNLYGKENILLWNNEIMMRQGRNYN